MKRISWIALIMLTACAVARAERVVDLPEYDGKFYLTVIYDSPMTAKSQELHRFVRTAQFQKFSNQCIFNEYTDATRMIKDTKWQTFLGTTRPAMLLQATTDNAGHAKIVFFAAGDQLSIDRTLWDILDTNIKGYLNAVHNGQAEQWSRLCPNGRCQPPPPAPEPEPQPIVIQPITPTIPVPPVTPEVVPTDEDKDDGGIPLIGLIAVAAAGLYGAYSQLKKEN